MGPKFIENLMGGFMSNNMGTHKARVILRPKAEHPEIYVDGTLFELTVSGVHHLLSRSLFVPLRGI